MPENKQRHIKTHTPRHQTGDKATVLGARPGNIGGAIAEHLAMSGWVCTEDDCADWFEGDLAYLPPAQESLAPYDACIVTLGTTHMEPFSEVSHSDLHKVIQGSLMLPLECARRYVQARMPVGDGPRPEGVIPHHSTIIFIGSYAHDHPFTHCTSYCVAKAGLDMATKSLAWELMPEGFHVHIIHPHHVQGTPMTDVVREGMMKGHHKMSAEGAEAYSRKDLRMQDLLKPREIAEMVRTILHNPVMGWMSGNGFQMYGGVR